MPAPTRIDALSTDVLANALSFLGPGHHRFVAGTCRRFRSEYFRALSAQEPSVTAPPYSSSIGEDGDEVKDQIAVAAERAGVTFWSSAAASLPCASLCLEDHHDSEKKSAGRIGQAAAVRRIGEAAALAGRLDTIEWLEAERGFDPDEHSGKAQRRLPFSHWLDFWKWGWTDAEHKLVTDCLAAGGHLRALEHCIEKGYLWDKWTVAMAAYCGNIQILECMIGRSCQVDSITGAAAAAGGSIDVFKFLQEVVTNLDNAKALRAACAFGRIEMVKYMHESCAIALQPEAGALAAHGKHLEVIKYLLASGFPLNAWIFWQASGGGSLELVRFLREGGCPWNSMALETAAREGHLNVVKYLCKNGCPQSHLAPVRAAYSGHLDVLRCLHESRCPWDVGTFVAAADRGDIKMLRYLHCNNCPWGPEVCAAAARNGHLEALRFLREKGCPWDERIITVAKYQRHGDIVEWATRNGCPPPH